MIDLPWDILKYIFSYLEYKCLMWKKNIQILDNNSKSLKYKFCSEECSWCFYINA